MRTEALEREPLKVLSLFTGAGGLDVGFEASGNYRIVAAVELEPRFCETLRLNRDAGLFGDRSTQIVQADLSKLSPHELMKSLNLSAGDVDIIIGGPPCQSWSTAGRRRTAEDSRGQLLWSFLDFVTEMKPSFFLMENVRGLLSASLRHRPIADRPNRGGPPLAPDELPGSALKKWLEDLAQMTDSEYRVDAFEVNAVNYGAPQLRERVLFFGNRIGAVVHFPPPSHGHANSGLMPFKTLKDALEGFTEQSPVVVDFSERKKKYLELIPPGGNWRVLPEDVAKESMGRAYFAKGGRSGWWRRLSWDLPCPTITTLPNHSSTSMCHPTQTRPLSVGEFARIQEFPDKWQFAGTAAEQMRQVGNAVPARLGRIAGKLIATALESKEAPSAIFAPQYRRVYLNSHVRTRRWWKNGAAYLRSDGDEVPVRTPS